MDTLKHLFMYYHFHCHHHPLDIHLHICWKKIFVNILRCSQQETSKNEKWHFHCNHHPLCPSSYLAKGRENKHLSTGYIDFSATAAQTYNLHHTIKVWHSPFLNFLIKTTEPMNLAADVEIKVNLWQYGVKVPQDWTTIIFHLCPIA